MLNSLYVAKSKFLRCFPCLPVPFSWTGSGARVEYIYAIYLQKHRSLAQFRPHQLIRNQVRGATCRSATLCIDVIKDLTISPSKSRNFARDNPIRSRKAKRHLSLNYGRTFRLVTESTSALNQLGGQIMPSWSVLRTSLESRT